MIKCTKEKLKCAWDWDNTVVIALSKLFSKCLSGSLRSLISFNKKRAEQQWDRGRGTTSGKILPVRKRMSKLTSIPLIPSPVNLQMHDFGGISELSRGNKNLDKF